MADAVQVEFGAKTDGIDQGAAAVSSKLKALQDQTDGMASQFTAFGQKMGAAFDDAQQSLVHFDDALKSLNSTIEKGGNVSAAGGIINILSKAGAIGAAIAVVAGLAEGLHMLGEEMIKLERSATETGVSIERFQLLQSVFNAAGVSTDKLTSSLEEISKKLTNAKYDTGDLGKFMDANNMKLKDASDHIVSMNDFLRQSSLKLQEAVAEGGVPLAFKVGESLGLSKELVRVLMQGPVAFDAMVKKAQELGVGLDAELVHKAADFEKEWNAASSNMATWLKAQLQGLLPAIQAWAAEVGKAIAAVFSTIFKQLKGIFQDVTAEWAGEIDTFAGRFGAAEGSITKMKDKAKTASETFRDMGSDLDGLVASGKKFAEIKFPGKDDKSFDTAKLRQFQEQLDDVREKYKLQEDTEKRSVDTFKETQTQMTNNMLVNLAERRDAEIAIFNQMLALAGDNAEKRAAIHRQMNKAMITDTELSAKLETDQLKKSTQEWEGVLGGISGAFTSQLRGILQGTTTWSQAIKNIMLDLVLKIIDEFLKLAIIKPLSGMLASALAAPTEIFAALIKVISGMFGPLMAGFTSFFAPTQGPAAPAEGAAAAAATVAAATAAVALDTGTDYVPRTGLALIHQGEAIIPASENMSQYSGGGGHSFNINLSAVDVQSFNAWLRNGGGANMLAKMISDTLRRSPTLRPSY